MAITIQEEKPIPYGKVCARCGRTVYKNYRYSRRYGGYLCESCDHKLWRMKGYQAERQLCRLLKKLGYNVRRTPTSGSGRTNKDDEGEPDVKAYHKEKDEALAFEVKAYSFWSKKTVTVKRVQIVKAIKYLIDMYGSTTKKKVVIGVKFLLGMRVKSPWIFKVIPVTDDMDLSKVKDVTISIDDESDFPELTKLTLSKRSRRIIKKRREKKNANLHN